jgi:tripartite-type tricarboxylate transporter receptor subunit TctC
MTMRQMMNALLAALAIAGVHANSSDAGAQSYPSRPITMVVPFAAGGGTDTLARIVAEGMKASLKQPVIVENLPGAAGSVALSKVSRAAPDGHTIVFGNWATHVVGPATRAAPYDVVKDFVAVSLAATQPLVIIANKRVPAKDLRGLIEWLKANPDQATVGTAGPGSATHVAGLFFQAKTGARVQLVPYRGGGAQSMQDLIGGHVNLAFTQASNALAHRRAGEIKTYAVTAKAKLAAAPDIPTVDDAGAPGLHVAVWHAIWAPKDTPDAIVRRLNGAVVNTLADPATRKRLADNSQELFQQDQLTPEALGAFHAAEIATWWPTIKTSGSKAD